MMRAGFMGKRARLACGAASDVCFLFFEASAMVPGALAQCGAVMIATLRQPTT
jgi:hypothetical protein